MTPFRQPSESEEDFEELIQRDSQHERHDFHETYYGWTCSNCGLFYAFGTAPWEDETDALSDYGDTNEQADRGI